MKRRSILAGLVGTAAFRPRLGTAQGPDRSRRIGVLVGLQEDDPGMQPRLAALRRELEERGWSEGRNLHLVLRFAPAGAGADRLAKELLALRPDVILSHTVSVTAALVRETESVPIVFVSVGDPIGAGFVASLARPGRNLTGFMTFEQSIAGKWMQMLKEVVPDLSRTLFVGNPSTGTYEYYLSGTRAAARALAVDVVPARIDSLPDLERPLAAFGSAPGGAMIVAPDLTTSASGKIIAALAIRHRVPAVFAFGYLVAAGGLMSYGTDRVVEMRSAASYLDRILRGAAAGDLPVQGPTKFETAVNLRTAKALGLVIPPSLLARADEVIE